MKCIVVKFGGTSMATADSIGRCAAISKKAARSSRVVVVVSALGGATDTLLELIALAKRQKPKLIGSGLTELEVRHRTVLSGFLKPTAIDSIWQDEFVGLFRRLRLILTGASGVGEM